MIRRLDAATDTFLTDLRSIRLRLSEAQRQVTSGKRITKVSDVPEELSNLLQLRTELNRNTQIKANLGRVKTEVDAAEQSMQSAVSIVERAAVLGTQGANGTMSAEDRQIITGEVEVLLRSLVGLAQTRVEARYIFSGDTDNQVPFTLDLTLDDPVSDYLGSPSTRKIMHPSGTVFSISVDAETIFDNPDPAKNVQQAINGLRLALRANDDDAIGAALSQVQSAGDHLNNQLAAYGAVQNQVSEALDFAHKQELRLMSRLSEVEEVDMTEAILAMDEASYLQEVALTTKAQSRKISLFDYIG